MRKGLVSIIIPTYNRSHLIGETLDSVIAQTCQNWECIVVDDNSTDYTKELLDCYCEKDNRIKYYQRPSNQPKGANACRNYGFELSEGEFINWFDSDDFMLKDFLSSNLSAFSEQTSLTVCSGFYTDENLNICQNINLIHTKFLFKDYVLWRMEILTPSVIFRKNFLYNRHLFNLDIFRGQETEFFSRIFFEIDAKDFVINNTPLFLYRQHKYSKSYLDKSYDPTLMKSKIYIMIQNLRFSLNLNDLELINHFKRSLMLVFFQTIDNNDDSNSKYIRDNIIDTETNLKFLDRIKHCFLLTICIWSKRTYRIRKIIFKNL
jgi:glycosyltransferase involved in cell wall biosynthesis